MNIYEQYNAIHFPKGDLDLYNLGDPSDFTLFNIQNIFDYSCATYSKQKPFVIDPNLPVILKLPYDKTSFMFENFFIFAQIKNKKELSIPYKFAPDMIDQFSGTSIELVIYEHVDEEVAPGSVLSSYMKAPVPSLSAIIGLKPDYTFESVIGSINALCFLDAMNLSKKAGTSDGIVSRMLAVRDMIPELGERGEYVASCVVLALVLLNCKNIVVESENERIFKKDNIHKNKRKGGAQSKLIQYKILAIEVPAITTKNDDFHEQTGRHNRLHTVTGHPSYYTKEKPLFGKYSGMVWIPAHIRGKSELGEIKKSYSPKVLDKNATKAKI